MFFDNEPVPEMSSAEPFIEKPTRVFAPNTNPYEVSVLTPVAIYSFLFLLGVCGIGSVWSQFASIMARSRKIQWPQRGIFEQNVHFIYILALTIGDFCVLLTIPLFVTTVLTNTWLYGSTVCKIYFFMESYGKISSGFLLVAISFDRCINVNKMHKSSVRSALILVVILLAIGAFLLVPLLLYSRVVEYTEKLTTVTLVQYVCKFNPDLMPQFKLWTTVLCVVSFVIPALLIFAFYGRILVYLCRRTVGFANSTVPVKKVSILLSALALFYMVCWAPFWIATLFYTADFSYHNETLHTIAQYIHYLPYVNSALNWLFYAALNPQFRTEAIGYDTKANFRSHASLPVLRDSECKCRTSRSEQSRKAHRKRSTSVQETRKDLLCINVSVA